jgi:hypothetical protein
MEQPKSRTGVFFFVALALAVVAMVLPWIDFDAPAPEPVPPPTQEAAHADRPCEADDLARVAGLEVGETVMEGWAIRAIACDDEPACTRVELAQGEESVTLRVCAHREGAPLAPATHGASDVFFDSPHDPEHRVVETTVRAVLDATVSHLAP